MMAVILAGGRGTRLRPYTVTIPKPLLPLGDLPIVEIVVRRLKACGVDRVVLSLGTMAPFFSAFVGDGSRWGLRVDYTVEEEPLGTAGPLRLLKDWHDDAIVMNGDILTTIDYLDLLATHRSRLAMATVALSQRSVQIDYGVVVPTVDGLLSEYIEKPVIPYQVSMGIYVLSPRVIAHIPPDRRFDMPELLLSLRAAGERVACYPSDCYWKDMGRFDDYEQASSDFLADPKKFLP